MSKTFKTKTFVLFRRKAKGSNALLTLLTQSRGLIKAQAFGAYKSVKRFGSDLSSAALIEAVIEEDAKAFFTLKESSCVERYEDIESSYLKLSAHAFACETLLNVCPLHESNPRYIEMSRAFFNALNEAEDTSSKVLSLILSFELKLVYLMGILPALNGCNHCGDEGSDGLYFSAGLGGPVCSGCVPEYDKSKIFTKAHSSLCRDLLKRRINAATGDDEEGLQIKSTLRAYFESLLFTQISKRMKSADILNDALSSF